MMRRMNLIPTISNLKHSLVLHLNPKFSNPPRYDDDQDQNINNLNEIEVGPNAIEEDDKHFEEKEMKFEVTPTKGSQEKELARENIVASSPNLLSKTNMELKSKECYYYPSLTDFEGIHPPGGSQEVILYTTSLRGIRKTFQDCKTVCFLLRSFKIKFHERDVSLHKEYREELWKILGGKVIPPKLFIKGRYIGGADEVVALHEMGWLGKLLDGTPIDFVDGPCKGCACMRFSICSNCNGSCKIFTNNGNSKDELFIRCPECNENGLVKCHICF